MNDEQTGTGVAEPPIETERVNREDSPRDGDGAVVAHVEQKKGPPRGVLREYFESLVVTAVMALFGMTFVVQAVKVPTGSMQNTILIGDHLLVNKFIFAPGPHVFFLPQREIRRGDIIVFKYPGKYEGEERFLNNPEVDDEREDNQPFKTNYVKRVVGLPGDLIEEHGGQIFINNEPLAERRVTAVNPGEEQVREHPLNNAPLTLMNNPPPSGAGAYSVYYKPETAKAPEGTFRGNSFKVPAEHYFVMGDNRDNSLDSRFWGYVHRDLIVGRAMLVYWSYDESAPTTGNFLSDFFSNTRWDRTGTFVK